MGNVFLLPTLSLNEGSKTIHNTRKFMIQYLNNLKYGKNMPNYDAIVIGGGLGGVVAGAKVELVWCRASSQAFPNRIWEREIPN